jgi:hypothetical protein
VLAQRDTAGASVLGGELRVRFAKRPEKKEVKES